MSIFDNPEIRNRLRDAFPKLFLNANYEIIIYPARNIYFLMADVDTERDLTAKILEWLSREASKSISRHSQKYHLNGINTFLGTNFTRDEMTEIYTHLGNRCNHEKTLRFIDSGYDMRTLWEGIGQDE